MQMNIETDYAVRTLLYLSREKDYVPSTIIENVMVIPARSMRRVIRKLRESGILKSKNGKGYQLARPAEEISMLDVMTAMEGSIKINRCLEKDAYCSRRASGHCPVHFYYASVQNLLEQTFSATTIADLASGKANAFAGLN
jgi:Rrf2 family nitric oxide-sensitive transcriptional repressor